jgi:hypothetical protein
MEEMNNVPQTKPARPTLLTVLCILTFIGSGLGLLAYLLLAALFGAMSDMLASIPGFSGLMTGGIALFAIMFLLAFVSLFGAIKMWGLKKIGFYMYAAAQILMIIVPFIFIPETPVSIFGIVITAAFIGLYASNLKVME